MIAIGLDGCRGGWVLVTLNPSAAPTVTAIRSIEELRNLDFDSAAIDIPIGLPEKGNRDCDMSARKYLGEHTSRVFIGVRRGLLACGPFDNEKHRAANDYLSARDEPGVAIQLWNILPKVLQVDDAMRSDAGLCKKVRESHPELVFRRLNNDEPVVRKKEPEGASKRVELLRQQGLGIAETWLARQVRRELTDLIQQPRMSVSSDDILDACACAIAARDLASCVPAGEPPRDAHGLPMQIWF